MNEPKPEYGVKPKYGTRDVCCACDGRPIVGIVNERDGRVMYLCKYHTADGVNAPGVSAVVRNALEQALENAR